MVILIMSCSNRQMQLISPTSELGCVANGFNGCMTLQFVTRSMKSYPVFNSNKGDKCV